MRHLWKLIIMCCLVIDESSVEGKKGQKSIVFLKTKVVFNQKYLTEHKLIINPNRASLNVTFFVKKDLTQDLWTQALLTTSGSGTAPRTLFSYDLNVCSILGRSPSHKMDIMQIWLNNFLKYGNLPRHCPIEKGDYYWYKLRPEKMSIPTFLLHGKYVLVVNTYLRKAAPSEWTDPVANLTIHLVLK